MSLPPTRHTQASLVLLLLFLLGSGFLTTSLLSYYASRDSIRDSIINTELPLTSDTVYSEIQKDLVRPILISSMMARDTFLRDWVLAGEQDTAQMTRYLREVQEHYGAFTSFFVSDKSSRHVRSFTCRPQSSGHALIAIKKVLANRTFLMNTLCSTFMLSGFIIFLSLK